MYCSCSLTLMELSCNTICIVTQLTLLPWRLISTTADRLRLTLGALPDGVSAGERAIVSAPAGCCSSSLVPQGEGPGYTQPTQVRHGAGRAKHCGCDAGAVFLCCYAQTSFRTSRGTSVRARRSFSQTATRQNGRSVISVFVASPHAPPPECEFGALFGPLFFFFFCARSYRRTDLALSRTSHPNHGGSEPFDPGRNSGV